MTDVNTSIIVYDNVFHMERKINYFILFIYFRERSEGLSRALQHQLEACRQGGGEKGVERHVRLNRKVSLATLFFNLYPLLLLHDLVTS
jgi:hypothetical protein